MVRVALATLVLGAALRSTARITDPAQAAVNVVQLEDGPTSAAHLNILSGRVVRSRQPLIMDGTILTHDPPQFVFDFNAGVGVRKGSGGDIIVASLADFPFLADRRISLTMGKMAYVSLSISISPPMRTIFDVHRTCGLPTLYGGERFATNVLNSGRGAVFPKESFQVNLDCEPVNFANLNSGDSDTSIIAHKCKWSTTKVCLPVG